MTNEKQNEVSENKEIPHEINSVSDLSQILQTLGEPKEGHTRFFRGHGDEGWQMLPSIYRETSLIENEDKIIKDALTYCPDDFLPSDTLFEKLVKLQHYGYSTRLLDLTANALVALYFAAWNEQHYKKDGELIILDIPDEQIKYGDSDTVSILAAISLQPKPFDLRELKSKVAEEAKIEMEIRVLDETNKILFQEIAKKFLCEQNNEVKKLFHNSSKGIRSLVNYNDVSLSLFNKSEDIISMLHIIHTDKPSFRPAINPDDLQRVLCVRAKLNNARISRQQGCFLLFGIGGNKTEAAVIPDEWQRLASNNQKILVKAESKADIMQELKSFGISKRTLFPELEAQATEIMNHYKPQKNK
ncbi:FRG domain-containing protein [Cardiobacterium hominis]|uniref:FRG domain-containing protein n=1 Tax=Cardiobacterium hominis TaxID=2718 RepID=UPI000660163A|nr:FRG domain-containing protein [Cardiobacterium hominis]